MLKKTLTINFLKHIYKNIIHVIEFTTNMKNKIIVL